MTVPDLLRHRYRQRLLAAGLPADEAKWTADQSATGAAIWWAVQSEASIDAQTLARPVFGGGK